MTNTITRVFQWKGMDANVGRCVKGCPTCLKSKHPTVKYAKLPSKSVTVHPWYDVAIYSIDPCDKQQFRGMAVIATSTRLCELHPVEKRFGHARCACLP
ncbi:hypothetical protein V7S43_009988 [Phytophthora oleae]|uniref:Integrase zinc-binding domain-containing protein n=1 Tax=Phytophthora oleae TaxID=2107226 RepID=A0ABD3FDH0_9STRA